VPVKMRVLFQAALSLVVMGLTFSVNSAQGAGTSSVAWEIVERSEDGLTVEVQVPRPLLLPGAQEGWSRLEVRGANSDGSSGAPDLPFFTTKVAVPAGRLVEVHVLDRSDGPLLAPILPQPVVSPGLAADGQSENPDEVLPVSDATYEIDSQLYATPYPAAFAGVSGRTRLRFLDVAMISVYPYRWVPAVNGVQTVETLTLRIDFVPDPTAARSAAAQTTVPHDHGSWDAIIQNQILNAEDAPRFRYRPARIQRPGRRMGGQGPEYRLGILESGIQKVGYDDLPSSTGPWPIGQVAIVEKGYEGSELPGLEVDVPSWIDDKNDNGQFDSGDVVFFYGQNYPDRFEPAPRDARYGNEHAYWLTIRDEGGVRAEERPSFLDRSDLVPETSFVSTVRIDRNRRFRKFLLSIEPNRVERGTSAIFADHTIWLGLFPTFGTPSADEFDLPGFLSARSLKFLVHHFERTPAHSFFTLRVGGSNEEAHLLPQFSHPARTELEHTIAEADLEQIPFRESRNYIGLEMEPGEQGAGVEAMTCEYNRSFSAFQNRMEWNTIGLEGDREYVVDGFNDDSIVLFDTTDPRRPVRLIYSGDQVVSTGNGQGVRLQISTDADSLQFVAATESGALRPETIELRELSDLWGTPDHEFLTIVHHEFSETLEPYIAHREDQGWDLEVVEMRDVADLFDHGRSSPLAVRRYLRYLFASLDNPPSYLLLVGDGSEDHRAAEENGGRIFVPTQTIPAEAELRTDGAEVSTADHWFVDNLTGEGETLDFSPDMHLGRLPIKAPEELETMILKIRAYEQVGTDDAWRNRLLFAADDEFSTTLAASESYQYRGSRPSGGESVFRFAARESRAIIHETIGFEDMQIDSLFLATYIDTIACSNRCRLVDDTITNCQDQECLMTDTGEADGFRGGPADLDEAIRVTRTVVTPELKRLKTRGYLVVAMQSHANRALIGHERVWQRARGFGEDQNSLQNVGKPFIYLGFGCHMSEFAHYEKGIRGDSVVEAMMYLPDGRGAIAGIASGSYEWLSANDDYQTAIARAWFPSPPTDSEGRARWILGEMFTGSKFEVLPTVFGSGMIASYFLLGDPTLMVEIGAPRLQEVKVNDVEWEGTQWLEARPNSDSLRIDVKMFDEVWLETVEVLGENGVIPPTEYDLRFPPVGANGDTLFRQAVLTYRTELDLPEFDYDIVVRGTDRNNLTREVVFPVVFDAQFEIEREGKRQPLEPGQFVDGQDSVFVSVTSPIDISTGLALRINGDPIPGDAVRLDDAGRRWEIATELPSSLGRSSEIRIGVGTVNRAGNVVERSISALTASAEVDIVSLFNFPNPFIDETRVMYKLSAFAKSAKVRIYTLRGREIRSLDGGAGLGDNEVVWDGTDEDGDQVANGVYFFRLEVESVTGKKIERIERIARVR